MGANGQNFAPSFTRKPKLRQEDDGNKLIFDCTLSANPKPDIEWFRGDIRVKESKRIFISVKQSTGNLYDVKLTLDDVEEEDAGLYKVKAKNKYGEVSASINLNFSPIDEPMERQIDGVAPTFAQKPVIKQEEGGKLLNFECRVLGEPKPSITWYRDGIKVQESARCKVHMKKEEKGYFVCLSLTGVTMEDAGKYKITAKNELGESNATISLNFDSSFMMLTGDESPVPGDGVKPTFTERPSIRQSDDCSSVIFTCRCVGNPAPTVVWTFKGKKLRDAGRHRMSIKADGKIYHIVTLEVSKVTKADEGEYKAIGTNIHGEGVATINLHFEGKTASDKPKIPDGKAPRFPKKPEIRQEGDKLTMECLLEANPEPEVTWYQGSQMVQQHSRISMYKKICGKDQYIVSITISNPTADDGGNWRVNAFNPFGDSNANIALNFKEGKAIPDGYAPTFLDKPAIIPNESGTMITMKVRCKAKPQPSVEWFKDGVKIEAAKRLVIKEHKVTAEMFEYSCIVKKPQPTDGGVYKCNIKNEFGELNANLNLNIEVAPTIKKPPKIVSIVNRKVTMECLVMSSSQPAVTWYQGSNRIKLDSRHCVSVNQHSEGKYMVQMEILKVDKIDAGHYKLVAKNEKGDTTSQTVELTEEQIAQKEQKKEEEKQEPDSKSDDEDTEQKDKPKSKEQQPKAEKEPQPSESEYESSSYEEISEPDEEDESTYVEISGDEEEIIITSRRESIQEEVHSLKEGGSRRNSKIRMEEEIIEERTEVKPKSQPIRMVEEIYEETSEVDNKGPGIRVEEEFEEEVRTVKKDSPKDTGIIIEEVEETFEKKTPEESKKKIVEKKETIKKKDDKKPKQKKVEEVLEVDMTEEPAQKEERERKVSKKTEESKSQRVKSPTGIRLEEEIEIETRTEEPKKQKPGEVSKKEKEVEVKRIRKDKPRKDSIEERKDEKPEKRSEPIVMEEEIVMEESVASPTPPKKDGKDKTRDQKIKQTTTKISTKEEDIPDSKHEVKEDIKEVKQKSKTPKSENTVSQTKVEKVVEKVVTDDDDSEPQRDRSRRKIKQKITKITTKEDTTTEPESETEESIIEEFTEITKKRDVKSPTTDKPADKTKMKKVTEKEVTVTEEEKKPQKDKDKGKKSTQKITKVTKKEYSVPETESEIEESDRDEVKEKTVTPERPVGKSKVEETVTKEITVVSEDEAPVEEKTKKKIKDTTVTEKKKKGEVKPDKEPSKKEERESSREEKSSSKKEEKKTIKKRRGRAIKDRRENFL